MAHEYVKISELDSTASFGTTDQFVIVQNEQTLKINGSALIESMVTLTNLATRSYVDAVVDSAPGTLDTLRELAAALNDDANFGATITNLINEKLPIGNFGLEFWNQLATVNTYHISEGSNLYWTQERFDSALAGKNTYHIAEGSNLYFTEQRVLDVVIPLLPAAGVTSYYDLTDLPDLIQGPTASGDNSIVRFDSITGKILQDSLVTMTDAGAILAPVAGSVIPFYFANQLAFPVAGASHGAIVHSHADGRMYFAHGGAWNALANVTDIGGGSNDPNPVFNNVTAINLNVQNVAFTGTGAVTFRSGNDLNFVAAGAVTFNGDIAITKTQLKSIVAVSTDFADFKARIAAL